MKLYQATLIAMREGSSARRNYLPSLRREYIRDNANNMWVEGMITVSDDTRDRIINLGEYQDDDFGDKLIKAYRTWPKDKQISALESLLDDAVENYVRGMEIEDVERVGFK